MKLPWLQFEREVFTKAEVVAGMLDGVSYNECLGMLARLWKFACSTGRAEEPPTGLVDGPRSGRVICVAVGWTGDQAELLRAFEDAGFLEPTTTGYRIRGVSRYLATWKRNHNIKNSDQLPPTERSPIGHREETAVQTKTKTKTKTEKKQQTRASGEQPPDAPVSGSTSSTTTARPTTAPLGGAEQASTAAPTPPSPDLLLVAPPTAKPSATADVSEVFSYWQTRMGKKRAHLDKERRRLVLERFGDGYSVEDLKRAIDGCARTPFNMGKNDRESKYNDLALICRNGEKVDSFMENAPKKREEELLWNDSWNKPLPHPMTRAERDAWESERQERARKKAEQEAAAEAARRAAEMAARTPEQKAAAAAGWEALLARAKPAEPPADDSYLRLLALADVDTATGADDAPLIDQAAASGGAP